MNVSLMFVFSGNFQFETGLLTDDDINFQREIHLETS